MEGTISEIRLFGPSWAPCNWMLCQGQLLNINQYKAFYSLLGNMYGGDGVTDFALPDLRGRVPFGPGQGTGLTARNIGDQTGTETVTLTVSEIPAHDHTANTSTPTVTSASITIKGSNTTAALPVPSNSLLGLGTGTTRPYTPDTTNLVNMNPAMATLDSLTFNPVTTTVGNTGGDQAHNNMQPGTCISFIICFAGLFPVRS